MSVASLQIYGGYRFEVAYIGMYRPTKSYLFDIWMYLFGLLQLCVYGR